MPVEDMPHWIQEQFLTNTEFKSINSLTFLYHPNADVVVLNRSHPNFDLYKQLVTTYLAVDDSVRQELRSAVPLEMLCRALDLLDYVIGERRTHGERS